MKQFRQGDVLLVEVKEIPEEAIKDLFQDNEAILAYGEVTGHAHRIASPPETMRYVEDIQGRRFIDLLKKVTDRNLKHEEHSAIFLDNTGKMQQAFQVEDFGMEVKRVVD